MGADMRLVLGAVAALAILAAQASVALADDCDTPKPDFEISKPAASVNQTAATFNGVWRGTWIIAARRGNMLLCTRLYVSVKDDQNALVAYCRASLKDVGRLPVCSSSPIEAKIEGGQLSFGRSIFKLAGPNKLDAQGPSLDHPEIPLLTEFEREQ